MDRPGSTRCPDQGQAPMGTICACPGAGRNKGRVDERRPSLQPFIRRRPKNTSPHQCMNGPSRGHGPGMGRPGACSVGRSSGRTGVHLMDPDGKEEGRHSRQQPQGVGQVAFGLPVEKGAQKYGREAPAPYGPQRLAGTPAAHGWAPTCPMNVTGARWRVCTKMGGGDQGTGWDRKGPTPSRSGTRHSNDRHAGWFGFFRFLSRGISRNSKSPPTEVGPARYTRPVSGWGGRGQGRKPTRAFRVRPLEAYLRFRAISLGAPAWGGGPWGAAGADKSISMAHLPSAAIFPLVQQVIFAPGS